MKEQSGLRCLALGSLFGLISLCCMMTTALASPISIGRYLSVAVKPQETQQQLLQQRIQVKFPENLLTIKQAIHFLLQFSGYHLVSSNRMDHAACATLNQALPEVDKTFGPMTLEQGLMTLIGRPFYLLIDPAHRLIAFQIKPSYRFLYGLPTATTQTKAGVVHHEPNKRI